MQGSSHLHELWDKLPIVPGTSQGTLDFSHINWGRPLLAGFYLAFVGGYSLGRYDMPQVGDLPLEQLSLGWFEL